MVTKEEFLKQVSVNVELTDAETYSIDRAYDFGNKAHTGQTRASGEPYFPSHPVIVALHLSEIGMGADMIIAGLLHDTIEDTPVTREQLDQEFGRDVGHLVEGVSKLGRVKYRGNERHVESLRKFFVAVADDVRVVILKLCDRWHNLETLEHLRPDKQKRIARESMLVHGHLASRLAMGKLTSTINDLAFPYAYPEDYQAAKEILESTIKHGDEVIGSMYRDILAMTTTELGYTPLLDKRTKGLYSLHKKLARKKGNLDKVYDLIAIRVIVNDVQECYRVLGIVHAKWRPVPGRVKDYIAVPKPNGYQSLHTAVFSGKGPILEIQVRTKDMHNFAEHGIAAHHSYKGGTSGSKFDWIKQLGELKTETRSPSEYLRELRTDFFSDRIFAMTPDGDVIDLPAGATILDFAFAVHTEIGLSAQGGKVNGAFKALKTQLKSEDIVEIVTTKNTKPNPDWLKWCRTNLAQSRIRNHLGLQRKRPTKAERRKTQPKKPA